MDTSKNSDLSLLAKFSYRVVIVSRFAVAQHFLWRVIAATSLVAMPSARKNLARVIKALYAASNRSRKSSF
jgi:hypothetical protein